MNQINEEEFLKEELLKAINVLPETNDSISAYASINLEELTRTMNRYKEIPDYNTLMKENNKMVYMWNELSKRLISNFNKTQDTKYLLIIELMENIEKNYKNYKGD